jgi:hypothetical protein
MWFLIVQVFNLGLSFFQIPTSSRMKFLGSEFTRGKREEGRKEGREEISEE